MKLIAREPTPEMLRAMGAEVRCGSWSMTAIFNAAYDAAPEIQQEPIYAFRRKGQDDFCTCDFDRYLELEDKPRLFEVTMFYPIPPDAQMEIAKRDARIAELEQDLQTTADALGHAHRDIERLERESSACDLLEEQKGTIKALNWALGGEDSTSTENLIDAHEVDYAEEGLILLCRKLTQENVRLEDVVLFQKKAWTADFEELERIRDQIASQESSPITEEIEDILRSELTACDERITSLIAAGAEYQRQFFEQSDQIKELSEDRDTWKARTEFSFQQRDELVAQNQQLRKALLDVTAHLAAAASAYEKFVGRHHKRGIPDALFSTRYADFISAEARGRNVLTALPDLASQHLNQVKAEALREAADGILVGETWITREAADYWLRLRADAIEKGEALAAIKEEGL